jgi:hypothetical protein
VELLFVFGRGEFKGGRFELIWEFGDMRCDGIFIFFWFGTKERRECRKKGCSFLGLGFLVELFFFNLKYSAIFKFSCVKVVFNSRGKKESLKKKKLKGGRFITFICIVFFFF